MSDSKVIKLSIVIPVHRWTPGLLRLLESIEYQERAPDFETILVANPPDPRIRLLENAERRVRCLESFSVGANRARNLGLEVAQGEVVLFVDDDCFMDRKDFLRGHWEAHRALGAVTGIGGEYSSEPMAGALATAYQFLQSNWVRASFQPGYRVDLLLGGNMSFKKRALAGQKFDPALEFGGTETEFLFRLASLGHSTRLVSGLTIQHAPGGGLMRFLTKAARQGYGAAYLRDRNYFGVPLVASGGQLVQRVPSAIVSLLVFFHRAFFRAGYFGGAQRFAPPFASGKALFWGCLEIVCTVIRPIFFRLYYLTFVEAWSALRSSILLRKLGLLGPRGRPKPLSSS